MTRLTVATFLMASLASAVAQDDRILRTQDPEFNPGQMARGTPTTWMFRTATDNAVATLMVDSAGSHFGGGPVTGAIPDGFSQIIIRAQDEIRNQARQVQASSRIDGSLRVMSHSYGYRDDPRRGQCRGMQCPESFEIVSTKHLRLMAEGGGSIEIVTGNSKRLVISEKGELTMRDLRAVPRRQQGEKHYACFDDQGKLISQASPCQ